MYEDTARYAINGRLKSPIAIRKVMKLLCLHTQTIRLNTLGRVPVSFSSAGSDSLKSRVIIRQMIVRTPGKARVDCFD